jgi:serine/threonine-protein kinase RsbW
MPENLRISASYLELRNAADRLRSLLGQSGVAKEMAGSCELVLQELLTNIVDHAYEGDASQFIEIHLSLKGERLVIETIDTGFAANVDLDAVAMPDPLDFQEGGYGIAIIKTLADEISYRRQGDKNLWKLTIRTKRGNSSGGGTNPRILSS